MRQIVRDFKTYGYFLFEIISRDFQKKYYRSALGVLWAVLNPLLMMCVTSIVFSTLFKRSIDNYPVYYFSGFLLFNLCRDSTTQSLHAVTENAGLIKKIHVPNYFFALSKVVLSLINALFSLVALLLVMLVTGLPPRWTFLMVPIPLALVLVFSAGLGMALSAMAVYFRDLVHLYGFVTLVWMYLTPLFYPVSIIPDRWMFLIRLNPMFYYVDWMRCLVYEGILPGKWTVIIACLISAAALLAGGWIFRKLRTNFILHI